MNLVFKNRIWLIIEPTFIGHHYTYLENIIAQSNLHNVSVIIATQNNNEGSLIKKNILKCFKEPPIIYCIGNLHKQSKRVNFFSLIYHEIKVRSYYKMVFEKVSLNHTIDHVFLPYIDDFTYSLSLFRSPFGNITYSGISMRQRFHIEYKLTSRFNKFVLFFKKHLFVFLLKKKMLKNIFIIDPKLKDYINFKYRNLSHKVKYLADPVIDLNTNSNNNIRESLKIPNENMVLLIFGYIDQRKGVDVLINWAITNNKISPITILIVGNQSPEIREYINSVKLCNEIHLIVKDEFVSNNEEGHYFTVSDIVWVAYPNFLFMSSVLVKAAQAQKSIFYYEGGLIAYFANKYGSDLDKNSFFVSKGYNLNNGLRIKNFSSPYNNFVYEHTWNNAGNIIFNS